VTDDTIEIVNEENNIKNLKKWLKISIMVDSLEDFIRQTEKWYSNKLKVTQRN